MNLLLKLANRQLGITSGSLNYIEEGISFSFSGITLLLNCGAVDFSSYRMEQFSFILVKAKDYLEGQTRLLTLSEGTRVGWIFPMNSLVDRSNLPDETWAKVYANFALNAAVTLPTFTENSREVGYSENGIYSLLDFYPQELAIVVLGNQALRESNTGVDQISLLLMQYGYLTIDQRANTNNAILDIESKFTTDGQVVRVGKVSQDIVAHVDSLRLMYYRALQDSNPCLCYFSLYQTIEMLLLSVFESAIRVYGEDEIIKNNPWMLREKFSEIAAEKWRLDALINRFVKSSISQSLLDQVVSICVDFLERNRLVEKPPENVATCIYLVRNAVVHRQLHVQEETYSCLRELNVLFFRLCIEIIEKFDLETGERNLLASITQGRSTT